MALNDWSPLSGLSIHDFLWEARRSNQEIVCSIKNITSSLGSAEELQRRGWMVVAENQKAGVTTISKKLDSVVQALDGTSRNVAELEQSTISGFNEISAVLRWGFNSLNLSIGRLNNNLRAIRKAVEYPSWTWAYEQYIAACHAFRNGWYDKALQYAERAIAGNGAQSGYDLDGRFYYLLGQIRIGSWLGSHPNIDRELFQPWAAEDAFLKAARYLTENKFVTLGQQAEAYLWAGRAAFLQGNTPKARAHTVSGIKQLKWLSADLNEGITNGEHYNWPAARMVAKEFEKLLADARYQHSKYRFSEGHEIELAEKQLLALCDENLELLVLAEGDADFCSRPESLHRVITALTDRRAKPYRSDLEQLDTTIANARNYRFEGVPASALLADEIAAADELRERVVTKVASGGVLDYDTSAKELRDFFPKLEPLFGWFMERFETVQMDSWKMTREHRLAEKFSSELDSVQGVQAKEKAFLDEIIRKHNERGGAEIWFIGAGLLLLTIGAIRMKCFADGCERYVYLGEGLAFTVFIVILGLFLMSVHHFAGHDLSAAQRALDVTDVAVRAAKARRDHATEVAAKARKPFESRIDSLHRQVRPF